MLTFITFYTLDGKKRNALQKGINIIKVGGQTKKVLVKWCFHLRIPYLSFTSHSCPILVRYLFDSCSINDRTSTGQLPNKYRTNIGGTRLPPYGYSEPTSYWERILMRFFSVLFNLRISPSIFSRFCPFPPLSAFRFCPIPHFLPPILEKSP